MAELEIANYRQGLLKFGCYRIVSAYHLVLRRSVHPQPVSICFHNMNQSQGSGYK